MATQKSSDSRQDGLHEMDSRIPSHKPHVGIFRSPTWREGSKRPEGALTFRYAAPRHSKASEPWGDGRADNEKGAKRPWCSHMCWK